MLISKALTFCLVSKRYFKLIYEIGWLTAIISSDPELLKNKVIFQSNVLDVLDAVTI